MFSDVREDFLAGVYYAGGRAECKARIIESCRLAINKGDDWRDVLESVRHNRPEMFSETLRRQRARS